MADAVAISPVLQVFYSNSFIPFITFFCLFLAVVRNTKLNHFLRYNTMQAILLDICVMLSLISSCSTSPCSSPSPSSATSSRR